PSRSWTRRETLRPRPERFPSAPGCGSDGDNVRPDTSRYQWRAAPTANRGSAVSATTLPSLLNDRRDRPRSAPWGLHAIDGRSSTRWSPLIFVAYTVIVVWLVGRHEVWRDEV